MAVGSARLRVVFILLLGCALSVFPMRPAPMPFGGSSSLTAHHSLKHPPVRPQRLRIYHPGQTTMVVRRSRTHGRDRRGSLHRAPIRTPRFSICTRQLRPSGPAIACFRPSAPLLAAPADPGSASLPASRAAPRTLACEPPGCEPPRPDLVPGVEPPGDRPGVRLRQRLLAVTPRPPGFVEAAVTRCGYTGPIRSSRHRSRPGPDHLRSFLRGCA